VNSNILFLPGEQEKTLTIKISKDIRKEATRVLTLRLNTGSTTFISGPNDQLTLIFDKTTNPNPPLGTLTFNQLMNPTTGYLGSRCLNCHNSTQRAGGYDMSDYDLMVSRRVLVPGSPLSSEMFTRLNPPLNQNIQRMPIDGPLELYKSSAIENWILNGALNN